MTMFCGGAVISSCVSLGFFFVLCTAQIQNQNLIYNTLEANIQEDQPWEQSQEPSLQCYDCNSEYDPRCGDPFDPYTIGFINCTDRRTPEHLKDYLRLDKVVKPVVCRKMIQKVEGNVRVVRGCGYIKDSHDDKKCFRRTGTSAIEVLHCSCTTRLCNSGLNIRPISSIITLTVAITIAIICFIGRYSS